MNPIKPPTVLIVDHETLLVSSLSRVLELHGYTVITATSGEQAIEMARAVPPDVLLCDVMLPGRNGIDTSLIIRELCPACRIVLMSGNVFAGPLLANAQSSGNDFHVVAKPFHPAELLEHLQRGPAVPPPIGPAEAD